MSNSSETTATPWEMTAFVDNRPHGSPHHTYRVTPQRGVYGTLFEPDAALIVRAVNAHDHLVEALKAALVALEIQPRTITENGEPYLMPLWTPEQSEMRADAKRKIRVAIEPAKGEAQ